ncbi:hypothetical protein IWW34DRAFT_867201 [Fusarium oxysporum f. sp. albedinis]|nr:hypothetical protein IWW34DRAFT_867201 [Fusarium oxysporum f. sp. albedinis]
MSGLEVTGIVLSSIPLLIIALEKYTEGLFTLHRWRKYKRELQSLIRNLETERIKLQNFCEKLPLDLVPHYNIEALIDNPMGDLWREEETLKKVQFRLGKGFKVFQDTANDLRATLCDIGRLIDSQGEGMFPGLKRAVFTLSRSQYAGILTEIRDSVSNLENLTNVVFEDISTIGASPPLGLSISVGLEIGGIALSLPFFIAAMLYALAAILLLLGMPIDSGASDT